MKGGDAWREEWEEERISVSEERLLVETVKVH